MEMSGGGRGVSNGSFSLFFHIFSTTPSANPFLSPCRRRHNSVAHDFAIGRRERSVHEEEDDLRHMSDDDARLGRCPSGQLPPASGQEILVCQAAQLQMVAGSGKKRERERQGEGEC